MTTTPLQPPALVFAGLDESGSLTADSPFFCMAAVITQKPQALRYLIRRAAMRSGKQVGRSAKNAGEIKWRNASRRIQELVLAELASAEVELFALTVQEGGRKIEDTPENYGVLACELLSLCWTVYPNVALAVDRHFTSPAQIAAVDTWLHRKWPSQGVLSIAHVDSQRSVLVQLADMVAGSVYAWHKSGDRTVQLIAEKFGATLVKDWQHIKSHWLEVGGIGVFYGREQKTELPGRHAPTHESWGGQINCLPVAPGLTFRFQG